MFLRRALPRPKFSSNAAYPYFFHSFSMQAGAGVSPAPKEPVKSPV
jgi:hypothetical protein